MLENEVIKTAKISKHNFMKFNAHKNIAEVYEHMNNFNLAKFHYTQVRKLFSQKARFYKYLNFPAFFVKFIGFKSKVTRFVHLDSPWLD